MKNVAGCTTTSLPRSLGGSHRLDNLALACQRCNSYRYNFTTALDSQTQTMVPLFNPLRHLIVAEPNRDGTSIFLVEQNTHMALQVAHHFYLMEQGRLTFSCWRKVVLSTLP